MDAEILEEGRGIRMRWHHKAQETHLPLEESGLCHYLQQKVRYGMANYWYQCGNFRKRLEEVEHFICMKLMSTKFGICQ